MPKLFTLQEIDEALENLELKPGTLKAELAQVIRSYFTDEQSVQTIDKIPSDELIGKIWGPSSVNELKAKRKNFSSLKSSLNKSLKELERANKNPAGLVLGKENTFIVSEERKDDLIKQLGVAGDSPQLLHDLLASFRKLFSEGLQNTSKTEAASLLAEMENFRNTLQQIAGMSPLAGDGKIDQGQEPITPIRLESGDDESVETIELLDGEKLEVVKEGATDTTPILDQEEVEIVDEETVEFVEEEAIEELDASEDLYGAPDEVELAVDPFASLEEGQSGVDEELLESLEDEVVEIIEEEESQGVSRGLEANPQVDTEGDPVGTEPSAGEGLSEENGSAFPAEDTETGEELALDDVELIEEIEEFENDLETVILDATDLPETDFAALPELEALGDEESIGPLALESDADGPAEELNEEELEFLEEASLAEPVEEVEPLEEFEEWEEVEVEEQEAIESPPETAPGQPGLLDVLSKYLEADEALKEEDSELLRETQEAYIGQVMDRFMPKFVRIPAGEYLIGSDSASSLEQAGRRVRLADFYLGQLPVTNDLFDLFVRETGFITEAEEAGYGIVFEGRFTKVIDPDSGKESLMMNSGTVSRHVSGASWRHPNGPASNLEGRHDHPVVQVSHRDASAFAAWAGKRLPSEEEWEAAARGANGSPYPWGMNWQEDLLNTELSCLGTTCPVDHYGRAAGSCFGILDLLGNVAEWTASLALGQTEQAKGEKIYIVKGGSWISKGTITAAFRQIERAKYWSNTLGFRCAV